MEATDTPKDGASRCLNHAGFREEVVVHYAKLNLRPLEIDLYIFRNIIQKIHPIIIVHVASFPSNEYMPHTLLRVKSSIPDNCLIGLAHFFTVLYFNGCLLCFSASGGPEALLAPQLECPNT